jgi:hypothetical protein
MFESDELKNHLETSNTISAQSAIIAEWNMNVPGNIYKLGNYRYRPTSTRYSVLPDFFDINDSGSFYTDATDSDVVVDYGYDDEEVPLLFRTKKTKEKLYYSLEDCIKPFRPRSGINKLSYFNGKYISFPNKDMYTRPRYYMPHKDDTFKYWRSYRTESVLPIPRPIGEPQISIDPIPTSMVTSNIEYGISKNSSTGKYLIEDANPFVVYKEEVPANRLVIKVQTNVGSSNLGPFKNNGGTTFEDPFYGSSNKTTPQNFKIQYLDIYNKWQHAYSFDEAAFIDDLQKPTIADDGSIELQYGLEVPTDYINNFVFNGIETSIQALPNINIVGYAYLIVNNPEYRGTLAIWNGTEYDFSIPIYKWQLGSDSITSNSTFVTDLTDPSYFRESSSLEKTYREFVWVKGIRLVVTSMNKPNIPLELIEISPRLTANITNNVLEFEVTKVLSDLGNSALPVGQIMPANGSISLFDSDQSFSETNIWNGESGSIIAKYLNKNIKFIFFEVIKNVNEINYYVPIKTLYSTNMPQVDQTNSNISIPLRDFYFYFESTKAPQIFLQEISLSQAVCILLDSIGFSNYIFKRLSTANDPIIPNFFIAPEQSTAEVLNQLAIATQSAMFFDEYNNFIIMTKEYVLDNTGERSADAVFYGNNSSGKLENIISVSSQDQKVINSGTINYVARYIARTYGSLAQSQYTDKSWIYKPSLLWEVSGSSATTTLNNQAQSKYSLSAMPLNTNLTASIPTVSGNVLINNKIDLGENVFWVTRFKGMLYANGEIIKYDAVEYNITGTGNVWISSSQEYQDYFSKLPFNGKIYPTGLVRIYAEPYYETINGFTKLKNGSVVKHGRGQFGTQIVSHDAGLNPYWYDNAYVQGCNMESKYLYTTEIDPTLPAVVSTGFAGVNQTLAQKSQRNGIIKNFMSSKFANENGVKSLTSAAGGTIQSSALVMHGPDFGTNDVPRDFVSYVWKKLDKSYPHIGTRVRIIGKVESLGDMSQSPVGAMTYFNVPGIDPTQNVSIGGGSAGISLVDPKTNIGYYFEIAALTAANLETYLNTDSKTGLSTNALNNVMFYKVQKESASTKAIPVSLWGGIGNIIVDSGDFAGQYRVVNDDNPSVYDLSMEYVDQGSKRIFYLYINEKLVKTVVDNNPITLTNPSIGLFVRGTSKAMFENIYALGKNYATNSVFSLDSPIASVFGDDNNDVNAIEALNKYAMSGVIQKTYLTGIGNNNLPPYNIYFEEFGTIMRECAYFNIKYDRAYPALYAKIAPTLNRLKGYTVSGFTADSYGAEFLVFNNTDTVLNLDETSGNFLRIQGVTFTQDTTNTITVDDYYNNKGNASDPELLGNSLVTSPYKIDEEYDKIKLSRILYGKNEFSLQSQYIQDSDTANNLLGWIANKNLKPKKSVGLDIFSMPTLQLGDIVNVSYKANGIDVITSDTTNFVVYNINYKKSIDGPSMTVYLSEV